MGADNGGRDLSATKALGVWSASAAAVFSITYVLAQLAEWAGLLGSGGGPESRSTPLGLAVLLTPSLLLGPSFLAVVAAVHQGAPRERKAWSLAAFGFATAYATLTGLVYFTQLTLVAPRLARGETQGIEMLIFEPFDSFLYAVDIFGYSLMSLATMFAAPAIPGPGLARATRLLLLANGLLAPFLVFQMFVHSLIFVASLWAITFPAAMIGLALLFRRGWGASGQSF